MKRIALVVLIIGLAMVFMPSITMASSTPRVFSSSAVVKSGEYVDLSVYISGNTGLGAYQIFVDGDTDVFQVDYDEDSASYDVTAGDGFSNGTIICSANGNRGWIVTWYSTGETNTDGELFKLRLKASESSESRAYPIQISYSEKNTLDGSSQRVQLLCEDGTVEVAPKSASFKVQSAVTAPGGTLDLQVDITANPGISSFLLDVVCDTDVFTLDMEEGGDGCQIVRGDFADSGTFTCNQRENGFRIIWYDTKETLQVGSIFSLPLRVSGGAEIGEHTISVSIAEGDLLDGAGNPVPVSELKSGTIALEPMTISTASATMGGNDTVVKVAVEIKGYQPAASPVVFVAVYSETGQQLGVSTQTLENHEGQTSLEVQVSNRSSFPSELNVFLLSELGFIPIDSVYRTSIQLD